jgi:type II secretory pathway pseudopilin PulG
MSQKAKLESGFTIVELLLAMTFVTVLLIVIAMTVIQIAGIYDKGLTLRAVNQAGTAISTDIRQTLSGGASFDISSPGPSSALQLLNSVGGRENTADNVVGGRLCTGTYSYIWNLGKSSMTSAPQYNVYATGSKKVGFVRVRDNGAHYCADLTKKVDNSADPQEFLAPEGGDNLAVQSFTIQPVVNDPSVGRALYNVVFDIGTNDRNAICTVQGNNPSDPCYSTDPQTIGTIECAPPKDAFVLQDYYCAVDRFDFTAQAGNTGGQ